MGRLHALHSNRSFNMSADTDQDLLAPLAAVMVEAMIMGRPQNQVMGPETVEFIAGHVVSSGTNWVWVEGFIQAGKSSFATKLANALGWESVIRLDHMMLEYGKQPDSPRYADHLDRDRLKAAVESSRPTIVEGVCLRDGVEGIRSDAAIRIYVARVSRPGAGSLIWHDGLEMLEPENHVGETNWLSRDVNNYHRRIRPHAQSDFIILRIE
jgi:hypothetical protein